MVIGTQYWMMDFLVFFVVCVLGFYLSSLLDRNIQHCWLSLYTQHISLWHCGQLLCRHDHPCAGGVSAAVFDRCHLLAFNYSDATINHGINKGGGLHLPDWSALVIARKIQKATLAKIEIYGSWNSVRQKLHPNWQNLLVLKGSMVQYRRGMWRGLTEDFCFSLSYGRCIFSAFKIKLL